MPNALSFYGSKMILDRPNHFSQVPIILSRSNSFWSDPNHIAQVQIIKISSEKSNLNLTKIIWTWLKQFVAAQNNLEGPKSFWTYGRTRHCTAKVGWWIGQITGHLAKMLLNYHFLWWSLKHVCLRKCVLTSISKWYH